MIAEDAQRALKAGQASAASAWHISKRGRRKKGPHIVRGAEAVSKDIATKPRITSKVQHA